MVTRRKNILLISRRIAGMGWMPTSRRVMDVTETTEQHLVIGAVPMASVNHYPLDTSSYLIIPVASYLLPLCLVYLLLYNSPHNFLSYCFLYSAYCFSSALIHFILFIMRGVHYNHFETRRKIIVTKSCFYVCVGLRVSFLYGLE